MKTMIIGSVALMLALFPTTILAQSDDPTDLPHHGRFPAIICTTVTPKTTYQDVIEVQGGIQNKAEDLVWAKRYVTEVTEQNGETVKSVECHYWKGK